MTSRDELISNIRYNEYRAENIRSNISRLNNQMDELERLRSKLTNLKNQFEERQSTRRSRLNGLLSIYLATSIFAKYCEVKFPIGIPILFSKELLKMSCFVKFNKALS